MQQAIRHIQNQLSGFYPESELKTFINWILESVCKIDRQTILLGKDKQLSANERTRIEEIITDLKRYRPIQYILGESEFYELTFEVNENVLIPRPETEELVDYIIINNQYSCSPLNILDIGTGSGCIAISLAKNLPHASVYAMDISENALTVAKRNAARNQVNVQFAVQDIFQPFLPGIFPEQWDIIVSNPPYITPKEKATMEPNVLDYEPHEALFVPEGQPLLFYDRISELGKRFLKRGGQLYFETSSLWGEEVTFMLGLRNYKVSLRKDISGKDRIIEARR